MVNTELAKEYLDQFKGTLESMDLKDLDSIIDSLINAHKEGKQVFVMGNGGSAATSSHFACDLSKGTLQNLNDPEEKRFKVIALTDNVPLITAYSNDLSYEQVFSQQLKNLVNPGDIVIGISASGNSQNIINAINLAKENKAITIGLLGFNGGKLKELVNLKILVNKDDYGMVEDSHSALQHMMCSIIREKLKK